MGSDHEFTNHACTRAAARVLSRILVLAVSLALAACTGHLLYSGGRVPRPDSRPVAFVVNPDMKKELSILRHAELYQLVDDPSVPLHLRLKPIEQNPSCGNPMVVSIATLGFVPSTFQDQYRYSFEEIQDGSIQNHDYDLKMHFKYSLYERLRFFSDEEEEIGEALRAAARR